MMISSFKKKKPAAESQYKAKKPLLRPDINTGLTEEQARELYDYGYGNVDTVQLAKTDSQIVKENVFTFFNLVFFVLAFLLLLVGSFSDMMFLGVAVLNTLIGIFQQIKSKRTLAKLTLVAAPTARVLRDGKWNTIKADKLVREDITELRLGDQIPADALVMDGELSVNESMLTGESDAVIKKPGDRLLSGSFVVSGKAIAKLTKVGKYSFAAKLAAEAKRDEGIKQSEMMNSLDKLVKVIGVLFIPIGIMLFVNQYSVQDLSMKEAVSSTVSALIGMIPEGLYLLTSVALAMGVMRLANRRTLVHRLSAIETLARVDVICVDKTGTITSPDMTLKTVEYLDEDAFPKSRTDDILNAYYTVTDADNDTSKAIKAVYSHELKWRVKNIKPFDSTSKKSTVAFESQGTYSVGAPEFVMEKVPEELRLAVSKYSSQGARVLLLAEDGNAIRPIALIVIENPIRDKAAETFEYFYKQGVNIKVISGDNPMTVSAVAKRAGINGAENYIDAAELDTDEKIAEAIEKYTVFGRVTPVQKRKFVNALQKNGHKVAMTGDGVNDVLALKDADCSVAMASGSSAASSVAQVVLMDNDFSCMPGVVDEGRRVINNIQRSAALYLVKNILSFFLSILTVILSFPYPFKGAIQLTLISSLTIGLPSFVLALEPNHEIVQGKFMVNVLKKALPGGLTNLFVILIVELFGVMLDMDIDMISTISVVLMGYVGFMVLYYIAKPLDKKHIALIAGCAAAFIIAISAAGDFFYMTRPDGVSWLILFVMILISTGTMKLLTMAFDNWAKVKNSVKNKAESTVKNAVKNIKH